jgi:hypothetical protein
MQISGAPPLAQKYKQRRYRRVHWMWRVRLAFHISRMETSPAEDKENSSGQDDATQQTSSKPQGNFYHKGGGCRRLGSSLESGNHDFLDQSFFLFFERVPLGNAPGHPHRAEKGNDEDHDVYRDQTNKSVPPDQPLLGQKMGAGEIVQKVHDPNHGHRGEKRQASGLSTPVRGTHKTKADN